MKTSCFIEKDVADEKIRFVVIICSYKDKWVYCKNRKRLQGLEIPGGHKEDGETPFEAARRELVEETGALSFSEPIEICNYSVLKDKERTFGRLYFSELYDLGILENEIVELFFLEGEPAIYNFPDIQPVLFKEYLKRDR